MTSLTDSLNSLPSGDTYQAPDTSMAMPRRVGFTIFFLVFGVFGVWSALAPIDGAALAAGTVIVKSNKKIIQHLEGGIVSEIVAKDGDLVNAGDPILILDNTQSMAQLEIQRGQYIALKIREARLLAERESLDEFSIPAELSDSDANVLIEYNAQKQIFTARRISMTGEKKVLQQRIQQLQSKLEGLKALRASKQTLSNSYADELEDIKALLKQGFSDKNKLRVAERNFAMLEGEAAELTANISSTEVQIGETQLQILQQDNEFQNQVVTDLGETQTALNDTKERIIALEDIVSRKVIRAPVRGVINGMQVHTIGGVVGPGTGIAEVVPQAEELIVEARVQVIDIDRVAVGQEATIRFSSFNRSVPEIFGKVISLSADALHDKNSGIPFYLAKIEVTPEGMSNLGNLTLVPGMPAEAFINTGSRTFLQYMFKPLSNALARSFIED